MVKVFPLDFILPIDFFFAQISEENPLLGSNDVALPGNADRCKHVISGDHNRPDIRNLKLFNDRRRYWFQFILHNNKSKFKLNSITR